MALLSDAQRREAWAELMAEVSRRRESVALTKPDLRAAINAVDQWVSDNAASFNTALPAAAQAGLTPSQKAELLVFVTRKRFVEAV